MNKPKQGGAREGAGRKPKDQNGKAVNVTVRLSPDNFKLRQEMGDQFADWVNGKMGEVRES